MYIKLVFKDQTDKAYQLENDSWIPKSILDGRGLKHPYYHIKDWWLKIQVENIRTKTDELKYLGRKKEPTLEDVENSKKVLFGIQPLVIKMIDIPNDIRKYWSEYWSDASSNLGCYTPDYEPRIWGNDCFDGEMSTYFD